MAHNQSGRFNDLPLTEKCLILAEHGYYLYSTTGINSYYHLYSLNRYFVWVEYSTTCKQITNILMVHKPLEDYVMSLYYNNVTLPALKEL